MLTGKLDRLDMVTSNIASDRLVAPRGALAPGKSQDVSLILWEYNIH